MNDTKKRPPWRVTFQGSFWSHPKGARAGETLALENAFPWAGKAWYLPAVYLCGQGLVLDLCLEAEADALHAFLDKWGPKEHQLTDWELSLVEAEHPLRTGAALSVAVNGKVLTSYHGHGLHWYPGRENPPEARWLLDHYGLSPEKAWSIHRYAFPWATKRRPKLSALTLTLTPEPTPFPGPQITLHRAGDSVPLTHPATGVVHTLTAVEYEAQEAREDFFQDDAMVYPRHYVGLTYRLDPPLPQGAITLQDCRSADRPYPKEPDPMAPQVNPGIALFTLAEEDPALHGALSSLTFQPQETVTWQVVFQDTLHAPLTLDLL